MLSALLKLVQQCQVFLFLGFIDVYSEDKQTIGQHGARILNVSMHDVLPLEHLI